MSLHGARLRVTRPCVACRTMTSRRLRFSALEGHLEVVRLLIEHGANIGAQTMVRYAP